MSVNKKHEAFVRAYLDNPGITMSDAAKAAGYSDKNARKMGSKLAALPEIAARIAQHTQRAMETAEVDAARVIREIARVAFVDPRKYFHEDGRVKEIHELDDDAAAALAGIDVETRFERADGGEKSTADGYTVKKFKLADKLGALEKLMKYLSAYPAAKAPLDEHGKAVGNVYITVPAKSPRGESAGNT